MPHAGPAAGQVERGQRAQGITHRGGQIVVCLTQGCVLGWCGGRQVEHCPADDAVGQRLRHDRDTRLRERDRLTHADGLTGEPGGPAEPAHVARHRDDQPGRAGACLAQRRQQRGELTRALVTGGQFQRRRGSFVVCHDLVHLRPDGECVESVVRRCDSMQPGGAPHSERGTWEWHTGSLLNAEVDWFQGSGRRMDQ
nr:hypothetical protein [Kibdelosporangium sp. MJ126-NF4]CTQ97603.1 hypothetical protein [Kibdelosporangium sp. MJ126-NF4]